MTSWLPLDLTPLFTPVCICPCGLHQSWLSLTSAQRCFFFFLPGLPSGGLMCFCKKGKKPLGVRLPCMLIYICHAVYRENEIILPTSALFTHVPQKLAIPSNTSATAALSITLLSDFLHTSGELPFLLPPRCNFKILGATSNFSTALPPLPFPSVWRTVGLKTLHLFSWFNGCFLNWLHL